MLRETNEECDGREWREGKESGGKGETEKWREGKRRRGAEKG